MAHRDCKHENGTKKLFHYLVCKDCQRIMSYNGYKGYTEEEKKEYPR